VARRGEDGEKNNAGYPKEVMAWARGYMGEGSKKGSKGLQVTPKDRDRLLKSWGSKKRAFRREKKTKLSDAQEGKSESLARRSRGGWKREAASLGGKKKKSEGIQRQKKGAIRSGGVSVGKTR